MHAFFPWEKQPLVARTRTEGTSGEAARDSEQPDAVFDFTLHRNRLDEEPAAHRISLAEPGRP